MKNPSFVFLLIAVLLPCVSLDYIYEFENRCESSQTLKHHDLQNDLSNLKPYSIPRNYEYFTVHLNTDIIESLPNVNEIISSLARSHGMISRGQVGLLSNTFLLEAESPNNSYDIKLSLFGRKRANNIYSQKIVKSLLGSSPSITDVNHQVPRWRYKRSLEFVDPLYPRQWHLNSNYYGNINVQKVWEQGITGKGIRVAVVDDGIYFNHPDLQPNFDSESSYDFNRFTNEPMPQYEADEHGTRCAGEIAAVANNSVCGVGVAFDAKVAGMRILSDPITDAIEAMAINRALERIDIYSNSWGPADDGKTVEGPGPLFQDALVKGVTQGRNGRGAIYVFAAGNGGLQKDNCNFDGYTNSIYTLTIGAIDYMDRRPGFSELCAAQFAVTYSSGPSDHIVTTDWPGPLRGSRRTECTNAHTGTSAAAPIAAGMFALALQARPELTWRDMQWLTMTSAIPNQLSDSDWERNGAGRLFNHKFGYGRLDANVLVTNARNWKLVGPQLTYASGVTNVRKSIDYDKSLPSISSVINVPAGHQKISKFKHLEHVAVTVHMTHPTFRGAFEIYLISPQGTVSTLATSRPFDKGTTLKWTFTSVKHFGESPAGNWTLNVTNSRDTRSGFFESWQLTLYGEENSFGVKSEPSLDDHQTQPPKSLQVSKPTQISALDIPTNLPANPSTAGSSSLTNPSLTLPELHFVSNFDSKGNVGIGWQSLRSVSITLFSIGCLVAVGAVVIVTAWYIWRRRQPQFLTLNQYSHPNYDSFVQM